MVAGRNDDEHDEHRVADSEETHRGVPAVHEKARADDERIADVHARNRGERVVEGADEAVVQVDLAARDRVGEPSAAMRGGAVGKAT